jgi:hypothetical protein
MVRECGEEDAEDDWQRALEARRQHQGQNLSFVTDLGEADEHGRDKERFHGDAIGVGRDVNLGTDPPPNPGAGEPMPKVSPNLSVRLRHGRSQVC